MPQVKTAAWRSYGMRPHAGKRNDKSRVRALNICRIFLPQRNWRVHKAGAHDPLAIPPRATPCSLMPCADSLSRREIFIYKQTQC